MLISNDVISNKNNYLPTLLERLLDHSPKSLIDRERSVDINKMRLLVQRDIADLMNHTNIEDILDAHQHKNVMSSVLNYGVPALMGVQVSYNNWEIIEKAIRNTILRFEPRIMPESLQVNSLRDSDCIARYAIIYFEIRGLIYWFPKPVDLCISGRYDFESEKVELTLR